MEQLKSLTDSRLLGRCIYCGGPGNTREHVPSKVFLDKPYPENLPIVGACLKCNNSLSADEEYVSTFIEVINSTTVEPSEIKRVKISDILINKPALKERIKNSMIVDSFGKANFNVESKRMEKIIIKLARGHVAFELSQYCRYIPSYIWWGDINTLSKSQRDDFISDDLIGVLGEIGSRSSRRLIVIECLLKETNSNNFKKSNFVFNPWIEVQRDRYKYIVSEYEDNIKVRIIIRGFFACEVIWNLIK